MNRRIGPASGDRPEPGLGGDARRVVVAGRPSVGDSVPVRLAHVLVVAYAFPPAEGPGVYRSLKFCKYLPGWGWTPTVICARPGDRDARDETLSGEIPPGTEVHRLPSPRGATRAFILWFSRYPLLWRLIPHLEGVLAFPDGHRRWRRLAEREGLRILARGGVDVIYTSSPPCSTHLVGRALKRASGLPWVADFRDPWCRPELDQLARWTLPRYRRAEQAIAREADRLVFAHPLEADSVRERHALDHGKVSCITNGFDADDFRGWNPPPEPRGRVHIVHLGSFYDSYNPAPLKRALLLARERHSTVPEHVKLTFVGGTPIPFDDVPGLAVEVTKRVRHSDALRYLQQADVTLNVYERSVGPHNVSGKLYEYLAAGRPILAIVPEDGTTADIIRRCGAGFIADPDKPDAILWALDQSIRAARREMPFAPDRDRIERFSRSRLTGDLAQVFDQIRRR